MSVLPRNLPTTAATTAGDDYVQLDGATNKSRKFLASLWATLASPVFTGTPTGPTPTGATPKALVTIDYITGIVNAAYAAADAVVQAFSIQRANHTGTQSADTLTDGTTNKAFLETERTKLAGIAAGATANSSDSALLNRANHTGTQAVATITGLGTAALLNISAWQIPFASGRFRANTYAIIGTLRGVSGIVHNSGGVWTVTLSAAQASANYKVCISSCGSSWINAYNHTTTTFQISSANQNGLTEEAADIQFVCFPE